MSPAHLPTLLNAASAPVTAAANRSAAPGSACLGQAVRAIRPLSSAGGAAPLGGRRRAAPALGVASASNLQAGP